MIVADRLIDQLEAAPFWKPRIERSYHVVSEDGDYDYENEEAMPPSGSADEVRQLAASRIVLLHSARSVNRDELISVAEANGVAWLMDRWLPGLLSDWKRVAPSIVRLHEVCRALSDRTARAPSGERRHRLERELNDVDRRLVGLTHLLNRPELVVCGADGRDAAIEEAEGARVRWLAPESDDSETERRFIDAIARCAGGAREEQHLSTGAMSAPALTRAATIPTKSGSYVDFGGIEPRGDRDA